jgi:hypothetical protein
MQSEKQKFLDIMDEEISLDEEYTEDLVPTIDKSKIDSAIKVITKENDDPDKMFSEFGNYLKKMVDASAEVKEGKNVSENINKMRAVCINIKSQFIGCESSMFKSIIDSMEADVIKLQTQYKESLQNAKKNCKI